MALEMSSDVRCRLYELGNLKTVDDRGPWLLVSKEPAILINDGLDGKHNTLAVWWYDSKRSGHCGQFLFHLVMSLKGFEDAFATNPELGRVVFLGQVKEWPFEQRAKEDIIKGLNLAGEESYVVWWIVPIGMGSDEKGMPLPVSAISEVILIGHPELGLLVPEKYHSEEARKRVMADFYKLINRPTSFVLSWR